MGGGNLTGSAAFGARLSVPAVEIEPEVVAGVEQGLRHVAGEGLGGEPHGLIAACNTTTQHDKQPKQGL